jgi:large subunit ribosomal protein L10
VNVKRSDKKEFVQKLKDEIDTASSVIVAHYSGLSVDESNQLRAEMRNNGAKFKVTKNRLTKLALEQTQFKDISDLFTGPTAIAYSEDPIAPAKVAVNFQKKLENFNIIGGGYDGERIDLDKINFLATLPSLDEIRGKIVGLISAPAQKIASVVKEPAGQIVRIINAQSKSLEKSN